MMSHVSGKAVSRVYHQARPHPYWTATQASYRRTVMVLSFRTDRSGQTVQTQIRLLLEEQSDQGLHCLLFHLHVFDKIPSGWAYLFEF